MTLLSDAYCTPKPLARLIGYVDYDPCSNERSHIMAGVSWFGTRGVTDDGLLMAHTVPDDADVFCNPPYSRGQVARWVDAYLRTRFIFLVRQDPSTAWYERLVTVRPRSYVWTPRKGALGPGVGARIEFEPPPGVKADGVRFPHCIIARSLPRDLIAAGHTARFL
jgi:hypothetical protein